MVALLYSGTKASVHGNTVGQLLEAASASYSIFTCILSQEITFSAGYLSSFVSQSEFLRRLPEFLRRLPEFPR
jgi:hypothetical protein